MTTRAGAETAVGASNSPEAIRVTAPGRWLLLPIGLAAILLVPFLAYLTDDTFIYFQFARNVAGGSGFCFNPGVPTYGFTSPLWVLLLAGFQCVGVPLVAASKLLGALATGLSILAFHRLARRLIPTRESAVAATMALALNVWLLRWTLCGLETSLAVLLVLGAIAARMAETESGRRPLRSGLLLGLAALARPECLGLLLLAALGLAAATGRVRSRLGRLGWLAAGSGFVLIPWMAYAWRTFGRVLPDTVLAKGGATWFDPGAALHALRRLAPIYGATCLFELLLAALACCLLWRSARGSLRPLLRAHFLPVAWMLALPALYMTRGAAVVSRYLLPSLVFVVLYGFALLDGLRARIPDRPTLRARAPWALLVASAALNLGVLLGAALPSALSFTRGLQGSLVPIGVWLRENTPADATVAAPDIGAIGYFSQRTVFDLHGLVTPAMIPLQHMDIDEIIETLAFSRVGRPDYLVDRYTAPDRFGRLGLHPGVAEPLFWRRMGNLGIARPGDYHYTVYRLHWDRYRP